jgi:hypothetical protein
MMNEFVLADNGTVMLDERDVKNCGAPFRLTGFFLKEPGIPEFQDGELIHQLSKVPTKCFFGSKIETENQLMDVLRSEDIVF